MDDVFKIFDKDGSKTIDKEEAVKHWSKNFGKISANEFFNTVDYNHDGQIQYDEFVDFWRIVKGSGHSEEEIQEEVSLKRPTQKPRAFCSRTLKIQALHTCFTLHG